MQFPELKSDQAFMPSWIFEAYAGGRNISIDLFKSELQELALKEIFIVGSERN